MNAMKSFLRGIYFFGVGLKASTKRLFENEAIPSFLRNRVALTALTLALVAASGAVMTVLYNMDLTLEAPPAVAEPDFESLPLNALGYQLSEAVPTMDPSIPGAAYDKFIPGGDEFGQEAVTLFGSVDEMVYSQTAASTTPAKGDVQAWKDKVNSDIRAWIKIEGTNIDHPMPIGSYNNYYNTLDIYKQPSKNGVIWFDSDVRFTKKGDIYSQNAVIYGHNWTNCWRPVRIGNANDVMFAQLHAYDDATFAKEHPYITVNTINGEQYYQVFSVFYVDLSKGVHDCFYTEPDAARMKRLLESAKKSSLHDFGIKPTTKDKFITLSTCTRVLGNQLGSSQRFIVMAVKVDKPKTTTGAAKATDKTK